MRPVWNPRRRRKDRGSARFRGKSPWLAALWVPCYFAVVASPPGAGGSRYAGRVVDPDVRDDGEMEPEVELNPSPRPAPAVISLGGGQSADDGVEVHADPLVAESPSRPGTSGRGA